MSTITREPCDHGVILSGKHRHDSAAAQVKEQDQAEDAVSAKPWILVATIVGSSMVFINGSTVNVALPALQSQLGASVTDIQWIINAYSLFLASLILLGGSLGDHFGRKRLFVIGTIVFTLASIWCGLVNTPLNLIIARAAQGIGGALLTPGSLAIISASFEKQERGRAIGLWSGFSALTSAVGPLLGGWLIDTFSWRWIFFIHVPLALVVLFVTLTRVPESRDDEVAGGLDWAGAALATLGLGSLTYGLIQWNNSGLGSPLVWGTLLAGAALLAAFIWAESRLESPMVPLNLFESGTFSGANLLTLLLYTALGGALFFLPLNLQQVQGYSATAAGAALLPFILLMSLLSSWTGGLVDSIGAKIPLTVGPVIAGVGFFLMSLPAIGGSYWTTFFLPLFVLGLGMAVSVAPLTTAVMGAVPTHLAGTASGINNAVSRIASLFAIAVLGIVMLSIFSGNLTSALAASDLPGEAQQQIEERRTDLAAIQPPEGLSEQQVDAANRAVDESFLAGFRLVMYVAAGLAVASGAVAWLMIDDSDIDEDDEAFS